MALMVVHLASADAAMAQNLLDNAGFEQPFDADRPTGWVSHLDTDGAQAIYVRASAGPVREGTHAIAIQGGDHFGDRWVLTDEYLPAVTGGEPYELAVQLHAGESDRARLSLVWLDEEGETVSVDHSSPIRGTGKWSRASLDAIAPRDAAKVRPILAMIRAGEQGERRVAFDSIELTSDAALPREMQRGSQPEGAAPVQEQIDRAIAEGAREVRIQPGTYHLYEQLEIRNASDLVIDGTDVNLVFTVSNLKAIRVARCENITIKGFTIDFDPLPFVQGPVTRINADRGYIEMEIDEGYPDLDPTYIRKHTAHLFDGETEQWKAWGHNSMARRIAIRTPRRARIFLKDYARYLIDEDNPVAAVGDLIVINTRARECMSIVDTHNFTLDGTVFHTGAGITILGRFGSGTHTIQNVTITPGPRPEGATRDRLISTCADGINYHGLRGKLVVDGCELGHMADDSLNINGMTLRVLRVEDERTFLAAFRHAEHLRADDDLVFRHARDLSPADQATLASAEVIDIPVKQRRQWVAEAGETPPDRLIEKMPIVRFRLESAAELEVGQHVDVTPFSTAGFTITNNHFHDHRARGLRIQTSNGTVENNRFERIMHAAVTIGQEATTDRFRWPEGASWSHNIVVRNNTITDVGRGESITRPWSSAPGAIATESGKFQHIEPAYAGHRDLVIEGNTIDGSTVSGIHAAAVDGLTIRGNTISRTNSVDNADISEDLDMRPSHAVNVWHSRDVAVEDNTFSDLGEYAEGDILIAPQGTGETERE
ncbi:MAG: right-handed parallel beta-helix repeat-containing protein [Phycisphaeraceae bacterium]